MNTTKEFVEKNISLLMKYGLVPFETIENQLQFEYLNSLKAPASFTFKSYDDFLELKDKIKESNLPGQFFYYTGFDQAQYMDIDKLILRQVILDDEGKINLINDLKKVEDLTSDVDFNDDLLKKLMISIYQWGNPLNQMLAFMFKDKLSHKEFKELLVEIRKKNEYPVDSFEDLIVNELQDNKHNNNELIKVYRGMTGRSTDLDHALSWTKDYDVAKMFATRFAQGHSDSKIYEGKVKKGDILYSYEEDDPEHEVIVESSNVMIEKVHSVE